MNKMHLNVLDTRTPLGIPIKYLMDAYSILRQVNFQGLRCVNPPAERGLISQNGNF